ncbi:unnamed protein product, partial [Amoebophrya sp. A120]
RKVLPFAEVERLSVVCCCCSSCSSREKTPITMELLLFRTMPSTSINIVVVPALHSSTRGEFIISHLTLVFTKVGSERDVTAKCSGLDLFRSREFCFSLEEVATVLLISQTTFLFWACSEGKNHCVGKKKILHRVSTAR